MSRVGTAEVLLTKSRRVEDVLGRRRGRDRRNDGSLGDGEGEGDVGAHAQRASRRQGDGH